MSEPALSSKQPTHISFTQVKMRSQCPWAWYAKYRLHETELKTEASVSGVAIHRALETYARSCIENRLPTDLAFAERLAGAMSEADGTTFMAFARSLILDENSHFEWEFAVPLVDNVTFTGKVDYLTFDGPARVIVTDYKSFPNYMPREEHPPLQLEIYAWAVTKVFPDVRDFRLVQRHPDGNGGTRDYWWDADYFSLITVADLLKGYAKEVASEDETGGRYEPCAGSWCQWCRLECPGRNSEIQPVQTAEDYLEILSRLQRYNAIVDALKGLAKQGFDNFGKGTVGDLTWSAKPTAKTTWDVAKMRAEALEKGLEIEALELVTINGTKAKTAKTRKTFEAVGLNIEDYKTVEDGYMQYKFSKTGATNEEEEN